MVGLIRKQITASTLLEVLIAMVIIMVVFTIALKVFNNVLYSGVSFKKVMVHQQLNRLATEATQGDVVPETVEIDSILYEYHITNSTIKNLSQLEIKAMERGKLIGSIKCLTAEGVDDEN